MLRAPDLPDRTAADLETVGYVGEERNKQLAYLIATSDFTPACKKHADQAAGKLALVSGAELWRHLHILGWFG